MSQPKFERQLVGEPQHFGDQEIQLFARLSGRSWESPDGIGGGAMVNIVPTEVVVRNRDGTETVLEIVDDERKAMLGMVAGAISLAVICLLIIALAGRLSRGR
ncbi:MAG: hypothetical protein J5I90_04905 [Caldilineales bacterium]|nr:hypothetical protein [Caldilineales bacterium]